MFIGGHSFRMVAGMRFITLTSKWPQWRLKSPALWLFTQSFIQAQIKENIKAPRHWPLCGGFIGTGEFPAERASNTENISIWWCPLMILGIPSPPTLVCLEITGTWRVLQAVAIYQYTWQSLHIEIKTTHIKGCSHYMWHTAYIWKLVIVLMRFCLL